MVSLHVQVREKSHAEVGRRAEEHRGKRGVCPRPGWYNRFVITNQFRIDRFSMSHRTDPEWIHRCLPFVNRTGPPGIGSIRVLQSRKKPTKYKYDYDTGSHVQKGDSEPDPRLLLYCSSASLCSRPPDSCGLMAASRVFWMSPGTPI